LHSLSRLSGVFVFFVVLRIHLVQIVVILFVIIEVVIHAHIGAVVVKVLSESNNFYSISFKYIMRAWSLVLQVRFEQLSTLIKIIFLISGYLIHGL